MKTKTVRKKARRQTARTGEAVRDSWHATLIALTTAEQEVEKQIRELLKRNRITTGDAARVLRELGSRAEVERRKAMKELEGRLGTLQTRMKKERKVVGRAVGEAVTGALATLNIPSRREVMDLTKKVDQLGAKIDTFRKRAVRRVRG